MIVVVLSDCPPKLRGDLSKWLFEINTGVYVGNLSARVRDALWLRICENLSKGRATMVYSSDGEQHMEFLVHNTTWECVDLDGIKLMRRPFSTPQVVGQSGSRSFVSKAGARQSIRSIEHARQKKLLSSDYVVIDVETSGLSPAKDHIIELAAVKVSDGKVLSEFSELIRMNTGLSEEVQKLTGISESILQEDGKELSDALKGFLAYVGRDKVVGHNISFDYAFIRAACKKIGVPPLTNVCVDSLQLARRTLKDLPDYKLQTIARHFGIGVEGSHRALVDCKMTLEIYHKLIEDNAE